MYFFAKFNISSATAEQKQNFIKECISAYHKTIEEPKQKIIQIVWKTFQSYLIEQLKIPKSNFKAMTWRPLLKVEEDKNKNLKIKWR